MFKNLSMPIMIIKHRIIHKNTIKMNLMRPHSRLKNETCKLSHLISPGSVSVLLSVKAYCLFAKLTLYLYLAHPNIYGIPQKP